MVVGVRQASGGRRAESRNSDGRSALDRRRMPRTEPLRALAVGQFLAVSCTPGRVYRTGLDVQDRPPSARIFRCQGAELDGRMQWRATVAGLPEYPCKGFCARPPRGLQRQHFAAPQIT